MRNEIVIDAPAHRIFALASATENWPEILPHYRFVRRLSGDERRRTLVMGALRGRIPVSWRAEQVNDAITPGIFFRHIAGWTRGMQVWWRFEPAGSGTRVTIDHELRSPLAAFIGKHFVDPIATLTLHRMKDLAETNAAPSGSDHVTSRAEAP